MSAPTRNAMPAPTHRIWLLKAGPIVEGRRERPSRRAKPCASFASIKHGPDARAYRQGVVSIRVGDKSVDQRPFGPLGLAFAFLNETFSLRRRMAGTSTFGTGLATERQVGRDVVLALTDRALCQLALTCCAHYALTQSGDVNQHTPNVRV
jgi:hypothetical protein